MTTDKPRYTITLDEELLKTLSQPHPGYAGINSLRHGSLRQKRKAKRT